MEMCLKGVSMGFTAIHPASNQCTTAHPDDYYDHPESFVAIDGSKVLHVIYDNGKFKLTLFAKGDEMSGTGGAKLTSVSCEAMKKAVEESELRIDGLTLPITNSRALRKILGGINNNT